MNAIEFIRSSPSSTRTSILAPACILGLAAAWLLVVEIIRPNVPYLPDDAASAEAASSHRLAAGVSAEIAILRGDLWADYAITLAPQMTMDARSPLEASAAEPLEAARSAASHAADLAPHDSRTWLYLAMIELRLNRDAAGSLKMSYYTGPNDARLIPLRIIVAVRSPAINDPELKLLVRSEIRAIVFRRTDAKQLLLAAYNDALPEGKRFIEAAVAELNPALQAEIRAATEPKTR
jgi:hypothetical protein